MLIVRYAPDRTEESLAAFKGLVDEYASMLPQRAERFIEAIEGSGGDGDALARTFNPDAYPMKGFLPSPALKRAHATFVRQRERAARRCGQDRCVRRGAFDYSALS